jgi:anthranilate synthase/aminodeoxychorismate synthase-like glutamine amidotransferase
MIVIIDNYDSFVYNLAQYLGELGWEPEVFRNDCITLADIERKNPSHIVLSPGPCTPLEAGISNDVVRCFSGKVPILGVCLGHQCIGYVYGAKIGHASVPTHGKASPVYHDGRTVYHGLPNPFEGGRYHSLVVEWEKRPVEIESTAVTAEGVIMGIRHTQFTVEGVQFHPESIMTDVGHNVLTNFLKYRGGKWGVISKLFNERSESQR